MPVFGQIQLEEGVSSLLGRSTLDSLSCQNLTEIAQKKTVAKAHKLAELLQLCEGTTQFGATNWKGLYFKLDREPFTDFCKMYKDDEPEDLRRHYDENYPNKEKYYSCEARLEETQFTIFIDKPYCVLDFNLEKGKLRCPKRILLHQQQNDFFKLVNNVLAHIIADLEDNLKDPQNYRSSLLEQIPNNSQYGRFIRNFDWNKETPLFRDSLSNSQREQFLKIADDLKEASPIRMSAEKYFDICKIAYVATKRGTPSESALSLYKRIADGRDGGLLSIAPTSDQEFYEWISGGKTPGSHPFEIIRGAHLHTAIHLYVSPSQSTHGHIALSLSGSAEVRADETIKIALALKKAGVQFVLSDVDYHIARIKGEDWIAVSPESLIGMEHCVSSNFPDFPMHMNYAISTYDIEEHPELEKHIVWNTPEIIHPLKQIIDIPK